MVTGRRGCLAVVATAVTLLPTMASAQGRVLGLTPFRALEHHYGASTAAFLSPSVEFTTSAGSVRLDADFASLSASGVHAGGGVDALLRIPGTESLVLRPSVYRYDEGSVLPGQREAGERFGMGLAVELGDAGFWIAPSGDRRVAGAGGRSSFNLGGGAWFTRGPTSLSVFVQSTAFADTIPVAHSDVFRFLDAYSFERIRWNEEKIGFRYTDAEGEVAYSAGPVRVAAGAGFRSRTRGVEGGRWARLGGTVALPRDLEFEVVGGVRGGRPEHYLEGGRFLAVGFRWHGNLRGKQAGGSASTRPSPEAAAVEVLPALGREGARVVRFPGLRGARVELAGDLTDWEPVALSLSADGFWSLVRYVAPGNHRIVVRVDGGAWRAPPGVPSLTSEFGERVGLLLIR